MKFYLIPVKGSKQGVPIPIIRDLCLVGSDRMCQMRKDNLGAKHCAFVTRQKKVFVRDMDSGQPTIVNGAAIPRGAEWPLHAGDRVRAGPLEFMVQFRETGLAQKDLEEWALRCLDGQTEATEEENAGANATASSCAAQSILNKLNEKKGVVIGRLRIGQESGVITVRFYDELLVDESEIALIDKELRDNINQTNVRGLLDMKTVRKMSSATVLMFAELSRWLRPMGSSIAVCRVRPEVESALVLLDVGNIRIFPNKQMALAAKW